MFHCAIDSSLLTCILFCGLCSNISFLLFIFPFKLFTLLLLLFFTATCSWRCLNSLTRDWTQGPGNESSSPNHWPLGNSLPFLRAWRKSCLRNWSRVLCWAGYALTILPVSHQWVHILHLCSHWGAQQLQVMALVPQKQERAQSFVLLRLQGS